MTGRSGGHTGSQANPWRPGAGHGVTTRLALQSSVRLGLEGLLEHLQRDRGEVVAEELWALGLVVVAFLYFAAVSIVLTLIDLDTQRLPNSIVLPSYLVAGILFALAAGLGGDWAALARSGIGMASLYTLYFVLRLVRPGGMGGGDVKLVAAVALWLPFGAVIKLLWVMSIAGGVLSAAMMLRQRLGKKEEAPEVPYGVAIAFGGFWLIGERFLNQFG